MSPRPNWPHYDLRSIQVFFSTNPDPDHISLRALRDAGHYFGFGAAQVFECVGCLTPETWHSGKGNFYETKKYKDINGVFGPPQDVYYVDFEGFPIYIKLITLPARGGYVVSFHERN